MLLREPEQERVELGAFGAVERGKKVVLEPACERAQPAERASAGGSETDKVAATVAGVAAALDEAALLELVEQADELTAVVGERVGDRALRLARSLVQDREDGVVLRVEAGARVRLHRLVLGREAEPLEQERCRGDQLLWESGKRGRARRLWACHRHGE